MIVPPPSAADLERQLSLMQLENNFLKSVLRSELRSSLAPEIGLDPSWQKRRDLWDKVSALEEECAQQRKQLDEAQQTTMSLSTQLSEAHEHIARLKMLLATAPPGLDAEEDRRLPARRMSAGGDGHE